MGAGFIGKIVSFLQQDIWRIRLSKHPKSQSFFIKHIRLILLAFRGFDEDKCQLRASALTFFSLLSIVPVFAMFFGIAKGFGFDKMLEKQLLEKFQGQESIISKVIEFSKTFLENTQGGLIAGVGVALLFWSVINVLGNIESSFNAIWGVQKARSMSRKFSDYLAIMLICPILLIISSSINVVITNEVTAITQKISLLGAVSPFIFLSLRLLPFIALWVLFSFIYVIIPNTRVSIKSGIIGGIVGGTIYQVVQWAYIYFQVGVSNYNAIYGSFAALPLFLVWLQTSWLIVLLGAEVSFAHQNVDTYEFEPDCLRVSHEYKMSVALMVMHFMVQQFLCGKGQKTAAVLADVLDVPIRLLRQILSELVGSGLLSEGKREDANELIYQLSVDPCSLSVNAVIVALEMRGSNSIPVLQSEEFTTIQKTLESFNETMKKLPQNKLLKDI